MLVQLFYGLLFHLKTSSPHGAQPHYIESHLGPCLLLAMHWYKVVKKCKTFVLSLEA